ncbi:DUF4132 domain-containing protein [Clostridium felsineum]|uniref:DUF4132 domain-containing protein n=1 Tax=Clostridium felsineum TaxID=36839 RepID=UPI00214D4DB1|nr:DUF4132 domain-containing protein [Clostridium felsineum]MCR3759013.1 DUF4132 domain-containing protein [Clostridium felsineum]
MIYYNEREKVTIKHLKKILNEEAVENGEAIKIIELFKNYIEAGYGKVEATYEKLIEALWTENTKSIDEIFEGDRYSFLELLLDKENAKIFKTIWNKASNYCYSLGGYRRSYKSKKESKLYLNKNINKLREYTYWVASGFSLDKYFQGQSEEYKYIGIISDIIAVKIDNNENEVLNKLKEVIYNDNNTSIITREMIIGLLMSESYEAHKMIGELLLAAKLQEGLRQSIVESIDEGSRKGFIYILKIIIDNNLMRFSSVVRAFCTWTGLNLEVEKPKVIKKAFEAAYTCLIDEEYKNNCIASKENLLIYIGLWAVAFDEIKDTEEILEGLLKSEYKYKKLLALEFLFETQEYTLMHKKSCEMLEEKDLEILALAVRNIFNNLGVRYASRGLKRYKSLGSKYYGKELFDKLKIIIDTMPKKEIKYSKVVFPWINVSLDVKVLVEKLMIAVGTTKDQAIIDTLIAYKNKMEVYTRVFFMEEFLKNTQNINQKKALIEALGDRSQMVRMKAFESVKSIELNDEDYIYIQNLLKYKYGDLRKNIIKLLIRQPSEKLYYTVKSLAESKEENKSTAAIEIVKNIENNSSYKDIIEKCLEHVHIEKDTFENRSEDKRSFKNGFGLYKPSKEYTPLKIEKDRKVTYEFSMDYEYAKDIFDKFTDLIHENRHFEYEVTEWDDRKTTVTLGGSYYLIPFDRKNNINNLDNYPIGDKVRDFAKENQLGLWKLMELDFYISMIDAGEYIRYNSWYEEFLESNFNYVIFKKLKRDRKNKKYYKYVQGYIHLLEDELPKEEKFRISKRIVQDIYEKIPTEKHLEEYCEKDTYFSYSRSNTKNYVASAAHIEHWISSMLQNSKDDEKSFKEAFSIAYNYYKASNYYAPGALKLNYFGRALELGIIDENEGFKEIIERPRSAENMYSITCSNSYYKKGVEKYKKLLKLGEKAAEVIAEIEAARGDLDTEVTKLASQIQKCHGVNIFANIVLNSEKDTYVRGYNYVGGDCTKKAILSHLLKCCYPKEEENKESLKKALKGNKVTTKQLIEAAMYSPQWLDIVSDYIGYDGLKSACLYFHAHVNDYFSQEKAAIIARYTPISVGDLKDGAFDQAWFKEAYKTIGQKRFKEIYDSAKYIAGGSMHKRSQLFADATLGKLKLKEVKKRVIDKRNKDYLLTYGLIPVKNEKDVLQRYEYIQEFIKESKKFGAQRRASEARSAKIALLNLARNAGFSDVNRLVWNMETAKIQSVLSYLEPKLIDDIEVKLTVDDLGQADVVCTKAGKQLKNIPTKLKKNEYILEIKQLKKDLKEQYLRAKKSFEESMESKESFKGEELIKLCENPVLKPIIKNLLFKAGDFIGYLVRDTLTDYKNDSYKFNENDDVIIAHPVHLYEGKVWREYQKDVFSRKIVQPFKQVFRELYLPNSDELKEKTLSRRYAGHQVQPKKTLALLKTRGWIASDEEGLQKIYYKENIIATVYAEANWFSPADMESPVLQFVRFEDRKTYKPISLDKISKLIFSEVMRDMDLVVSVAHVGGVDPEASLSTIEIRTAIVEEILKLMKLSNVRLKGSHAYITGKYGEYTVHLGSGIVHKIGSGAVNILSVPSSHRGRIFLPFIDSDPRSVEIITKITLLAEDTKIKDPSILEQII